MSSSNQREDIQGLRCVAVLAVFLYHLWPILFKIGYLGVDIFFVISGYVMALQMSRKPICWPVIQQFYFRRVRRIVPIYLVMVLLILLIAPHLLFRHDIPQLLEHALPAVTFTSNMEYLALRWSGGYFLEIVRDTRLLLHTWSLSVEMQFYALVPLLFMGTRYLLRGDLLFAIIGASSLFLHIISGRDASFFLMPCRIWQFCAGIMAHTLRQNPSHHYAVLHANNTTPYGEVSTASTTANCVVKDHRPVTSVAIPILCFILAFALFRYTTTYDVVSLRIVTVITVSVCISTEALEGRWILSNGLVQWLGGISYVVYLLHWPIIEVVKYWSINRSVTLTEGIVLIVTVVFVSSLLDFYVDGRFRAMQTWTELGRLICALLSVIVMLSFITSKVVLASTHANYNKDVAMQRLIKSIVYAPKNSTPINLSIRTTVDLNYYLAKREGFEAFCPNISSTISNMTNYEYEAWECHKQGAGKRKALLVGNSHALALVHGVEAALAGNYSEFHMFAVKTCLPATELTDMLFRNYSAYERCKAYGQAVSEIVRVFKPDLLFIVFLYDAMNIPLKENIQKDGVFVGMRQFLKRMAASGRQLFISDPPLIFNMGGFESFYAQRLWQNLPYRYLPLPLKVHYSRNAYNYARIEALKCVQCKRIDYVKAFCSTRFGACNWADNDMQITYYVDTHHLNQYGSLRMSPHIKQLIA